LLPALEPSVLCEDLVVTLDTVKRHMSHILDKLGTASVAPCVVDQRGALEHADRVVVGFAQPGAILDVREELQSDRRSHMQSGTSSYSWRSSVGSP